MDALLQYCELTTKTSILDFGCGQGRFANGLLVRNPLIGSYCGIDTDARSIKWCKRWLQRYNPKFTFMHIPAFNARYNPSATTRPQLPIEPNSFDVAFLNSIFSHMLVDDVQFYLAQLYKALRLEGIIYVTAFIEEGVPQIDENPAGYLGKDTDGPLHRVRYEKTYFTSLFEEIGFIIIDFQHQQIKRTKQSVVVAKKGEK